jgi:threonine/homoserine/homoserine lactone efflux protein
LDPGFRRDPRYRLASHFRQGLLTNALNPKVALFFLALLPQFIDAAAPSKTAGFVFLGAWFILQGGAFLLLFVACVAPLRRWQAPPALARTLNACGAALFAALAARLALAPRT